MDDAALDSLRLALAARRPAQAPRLHETREAAVALLLRSRTELELLLIRRVERSGDPWSGHMALPGGRRAEGDRDLLATAVRETREEVGVSVDPVTDLLGALDEVAPLSRHLPPLVVAPFVARVGARARPVPDAREVAATVWVPVSVLLDEQNLDEILVEVGGTSRSFPSFRVEGHHVWGLTHRILTQFLDLFRTGEE